MLFTWTYLNRYSGWYHQWCVLGWGCSGSFNIRHPRPDDHARVDQALAWVPVDLTLHGSLPLIHNHLENLPAGYQALLIALPSSAPVTPSRLKLLQSVSQPTLSTSGSVSRLISNPLCGFSNVKTNVTPLKTYVKLHSVIFYIWMLNLPVMWNGG